MVLFRNLTSSSSFSALALVRQAECKARGRTSGIDCDGNVLLLKEDVFHCCFFFSFASVCVLLRSYQYVSSLHPWRAPQARRHRVLHRAGCSHVSERPRALAQWHVGHPQTKDRGRSYRCHGGGDVPSKASTIPLPTNWWGMSLTNSVDTAQ